MVRKTDIPQPLVAMNIGSSCVRAIAADWDERHNTFHILGCEYSNRHQSVEKGIPNPFMWRLIASNDALRSSKSFSTK